MPARLLTAYRVITGDGVNPTEYGFMWCEFALYILALGYLFGELMEVHSKISRTPFRRYPARTRRSQL